MEFKQQRNNNFKNTKPPVLILHLDAFVPYFIVLMEKIHIKNFKRWDFNPSIEVIYLLNFINSTQMKWLFKQI